MHRIRQVERARVAAGSVLESLAGISLPIGQGICTRVPLVMRLLQNHQREDKVRPSEEENIAADIVVDTKEVAGDGKGISKHNQSAGSRPAGGHLRADDRVDHGVHEPLNPSACCCKKPGSGGCSICCYVLLGGTDGLAWFCSIMMKGTLVQMPCPLGRLIPKLDKSPEGLLEKVTSDDMNIGLGYVCVRNRVADGEFLAAKCGWIHRLIPKLDKSPEGLLEKASLLAKCLPDIVTKVNEKLDLTKVNEKLDQNMTELNKLPKCMSIIYNAMAALMEVVGEYEDFPDEEEMHCRGRLAKMLDEYANDLRTKYPDEGLLQSNFLAEEMRVLGK
ncbi:putative dynamin-related protein 4A [Nymphaea thermarum]|nr:putative dynamin-related protein 4A [Nymphaea thermarum]